MIQHGKVSGYLTKPTAKESAKKLGLIVVQEWWGLNEQMKEMCHRFARGAYDKDGQGEGFYAVCPDLYHSKVAAYGHMDEAKHLMGNLNFQAAVDEIRQWIEYLKIECGCTSVGITGFCLGGALSLACASALPELVQAAVPFYGIPSQEYFPSVNIKCPLLLIFGEKDQSVGFSSPADLKKLQESLSKREGH